MANVRHIISVLGGGEWRFGALSLLQFLFVYPRGALFFRTYAVGSQVIITAIGALRLETGGAVLAVM